MHDYQHNKLIFEASGVGLHKHHNKYSKLKKGIIINK